MKSTPLILAALSAGQPTAHAIDRAHDILMYANKPISFSPETRGFVCPSSVNFNRKNQRQKRKDRRRQFASGNRKAFA